MPRICTICSHPSRDSIEQAILAGKALRRIAKDYSVSESSLRRHRDKHLRDLLAKSKELAELARADKLAEFILFVRREALSVYKEARKGKRLGIALEALNLGLNATATLGKVMGEMPETVHVRFTEEDWAELVNVILNALDPYPDAKLVLAEALRRYGDTDAGVSDR